MITAIDSSVVFDLLLDDPLFVDRSKAALAQARLDGLVIACEAVWAEVSARFDESRGAEDFLQELGIEYQPLRMQAAFAAGSVWRRYRQAGGPRARMLADFLIGAHALRQADRLLTRDRGFYRAYFSELDLLDPIA